MANEIKHAPEELKKIAKMLPDKYFCNFSLFQSLPDSWAIDQIFPIMPISRLDEKPNRSATLQDITCDSDGKIDNFISTRNFNYHLPVHALNNKEPYYIGVFLVGAYQEILGDLHNLFGDTNAVHVSVYKDHYEIDQVIDGETVGRGTRLCTVQPQEDGAQRRDMGDQLNEKQRRHHSRRGSGIPLKLPLGPLRIHLPRKRLTGHVRYRRRTRYFIYLAYDGTEYHGWQRQPNGISVQERLEKAVSLLFRSETAVTGAGRTDAGVHARLMVAHVDAPFILDDTAQWVHRLNRMLPPDIVVYRICRVKPDAHSRLDARSRTYRYYISCGKNPLPRAATAGRWRARLSTSNA